MKIQNDGIWLDAILDVPEDGKEKHPLVLVVHGFTGYKEEPHIIAAARAFNQLGYATLRPDMYGHGKSGGTFREHTLYKWLTNILALVDYVREMDNITDLYLCGHSQGGLAVVLAAAMTRDLIRGVVPMSPALMIPECARKGEILGVHFDPEHIPDELEVNPGQPLSGNYIRVAQSIRVEDAIAGYRGPVLLIHGDEDEAVPYQCSLDALEAYAHAELVTIAGDDHCYTRHLDQVVQAILEKFPKA